MLLSLEVDGNDLRAINLFMSAKIQDEFTNLKRLDGQPASRQYIAMKRRRKKGKCVVCKGPLETGWHCAFHARAHRIAVKKRYRETHPKES